MERCVDSCHAPRMRRRIAAGVAGLLALLLTLVALPDGAGAAAGQPPRVSIGDANAVEPAAGATTPMSFPVRLSEPATGVERVHWNTAAGTADGTDVVGASGNVSFATGQQDAVVTILVRGDDRPEPNETFSVVLSSPVGVGIDDAKGTGRIVSDEGPRTISISDVSVLEGKAATTVNAVFTLSLSVPVQSGETVRVKYATGNGTAVAGKDYTARSGTATFPAGASTVKVPVVVRGDSTVEAGETFSLNLGSPVGAVLADAAGLGTIRNDDGGTSAAPAPALSIGDGWVVEGAAGQGRSALFPVTLGAASTRTVTSAYRVVLTTTAGSAGSVDVVAVSGTLSLPPGARSTVVSVPVVGDDLFEGNETFRVVLSSPSGAVYADTTGLGTVADDEGPMTLEVGDVAVVETDSGSPSAQFEVRLVGGQAPGPVSFSYATSSGTASSGSDFTARSGRFTFPPGETTGVIDVPLRPDTIREANETFTLKLSSPVAAVLADATAVGTIVDDDTTLAPGSVKTAIAGRSASESAGVATVTVSFAKPVPLPIDLAFSTVPGSAEAGSDYVPQTDVGVTAPAGATSLDLQIPLIDDQDPEPTESFTVSITGPASLALVGPPAVVAILDDESPASATTVAPVLAVGDIACAPTDPNYNNGAGTAKFCQQRATSDLAVRRNPAAVLSLGDLQYENGELNAFALSYDPSWGRLKAVTHPAPGNHEYYTAGATGYYRYFTIGTAGEGTVDPWYAFDLGSWRAIALNSNCAALGGCGPGSPQETWLRGEMAAHPAQCIVAYMHHPRFSSGVHGDNGDVDGLWQTLAAGGADLVLVGHDHDYERYAPMNAFGSSSPSGVREIVSGLGGRSANSFPAGASRPSSTVRKALKFGFLDLTLRPGGYDWQQLQVPTATVPSPAPLDSGSGSCT